MKPEIINLSKSINLKSQLKKKITVREKSDREKINMIQLTLNFIVFENTVIKPPSKKLCYFNMFHLQITKGCNMSKEEKKQENTMTFLFTL